MNRAFYNGTPSRTVKDHVNSTELTIKHSRNSMTSGPNILDDIGSGIWGAETGLATVPAGTVDFSGDEAGIGGGGISSAAFPALARVVAAAVVFEPFLARGAVFGGIAPQLDLNLGEGVCTKPKDCICGNRRTVGRIGQSSEDQLETDFIATQHGVGYGLLSSLRLHSSEIPVQSLA